MIKGFTMRSFSDISPAKKGRCMGVAVLLTFPCLLYAAPGATGDPRGIVVRVDSGVVTRALPDRALSGHNLSFASRANHTWDPGSRAFKGPFWRSFSAMNPGLLRFPGGNWSYGFHFNLARQGIRHRVNTWLVAPHFRPQDFLKTIRELPDARALIHLSPIWSSPEEAAAFIAYMIGKTSDSRSIGLDSWGRVDPETGRVLDWRTVGYWSSLRERDGEPAYGQTLYFQVGNEEWICWCKDASCDGMTDYYGRVRPIRQMTVEDAGLKDPRSGVPVEAYWPNYRATYLKIRQLFDVSQVKIGALAYAKPDGAGGADTFFRTAGDRGKRWNGELLDHLNRDPEVTADFVTLHTYMYDKNGWEKDFPEEGAANVLFASDHLSARIAKIFAYAESPPYPVMLTEFNIHLHDTIAPSSLLSALFYIDYTMGGMRNSGVAGMIYWQTANWRQRGRFTGGALFATDAPPPANDDKLWKMGPYYAARLLGALSRRTVSSAVENAPVFRPRALRGQWKAAGESKPWWTPTPLPFITAVATLSDDERELAILLLNKKTTQDFDIALKLSNFKPETGYSRLVLNTTNPGGHRDIFRINPWRLSKNGKCAPPDGGCTSSLPPETNENVVLSTDKSHGASDDFTVKLPAHSAMLLLLRRAAGD